MTKIERAPQQLVLRSGSTTLTLDKSTGKAILQRRLLLWARQPIERPISDVAGATLEANVDRASGVEICSATLVMREGDAWSVPAADKKDAAAAVAAVRDFLGLPAS